MDPLTDQKSPSEQGVAETPGVPALEGASDFLAGDFEQIRMSVDQMRGVLSSAIATLSEGFSLMHEQNEVQRELLSRTHPRMRNARFAMERRATSRRPRRRRIWWMESGGSCEARSTSARPLPWS